MTWTTAERYRSYKSYSEDEKTKLRALAKKSPWRSTFHIEPETGLLNDPNGFSFFNGKWHLFYQHFPFGAVHGLKSWVHLTSSDLVHFEASGLVIYPDTRFDNAGAYSGSALAMGDTLFLMYTGNHRDEHWVRIPYQLGAVVDQKNQVTKCPEPLIYPDFSQTTDHFRDPQLFRVQNQVFLLIGAQTVDKEGKIKVYRAENDALTAWEELGFLNFSDEKMGYMIECPNLVFVDGRSVLIFCPQGLSQAVCEYKNIYPNLFVIADEFSVSTDNRLIGAGPLQNLDDGFDCYATQAFNAPDGSAYAISWLGLPDTAYETDRFGVQGALSMVKKLSVKDGKLYQTPVEAMKKLRYNERKIQLSDEGIKTDNVFELEFKLEKGTSQTLSVLTDEKNDAALRLQIDSTQLVLTRNYEKRVSHVKIEKMNIFIDKSIFEIFINDGEKVLSGRVFPNENQHLIKSEHPLTIKMWELKK